MGAFIRKYAQTFAGGICGGSGIADLVNLPTGWVATGPAIAVAGGLVLWASLKIFLGILVIAQDAERS